MAKNLHALLVAIDDYAHIRDLGGCKADIRKVKAYFEDVASVQGFDFQPMERFDSEATHANLIEGFKELISRCREGDTALIYFSGHGAQEDAGEIFSDYEADGKLEGWVCHDTGLKPEHAPLLADKELRYFINQLSEVGAKVLYISDSCHAGDNNRSAQGEVELPERRATFEVEGQARTGVTLPARAYSEFVFADKIPASAFETQLLDDLIPLGNQVAFGACEAWEFAYENQHGGVFTHHLLETLRQTQGDISYYDLQSRVRGLIKANLPTVSQVPRAGAMPEEDLFKTFLGDTVQEHPVYGNLTNLKFIKKQKSLWRYDKGAIHGVSRSKAGDDSSLVAIPVGNGKMAYGYVIEVGSSESTVELKPTESSFELLDPQKTYTGYLAGLMSAPLYVYVTGLENWVEKVNAHIEENVEKMRKANLYFTDDPQQAQYFLQAVHTNNRDYLIITYPFDMRPLVVQAFGKTAVEEVMERLKHMVKWQYTFALNNEASDALPKDAIRVDIAQGPHILSHQNNIVEVQYDGEHKGQPATAIKITLTNTSEFDLQVACMYMDTDFSVFPGILSPSVTMIPAGGSVRVREGKSIPLRYSPQLEQFNWPTDRFFFQVVFSNQPFTADEFTLKGLPKPVSPWPDRSTPTPKGLVWDEPEETIAADTWQTNRIEIQVPNPKYRAQV